MRGADPNIGRQAALEDTERIIQTLSGADMVFIATGLGGGTGTGAAPVIASLAGELGALTVAVVTKPFRFEGKRRAMHAEAGLDALRECVDTVITIPNERLIAIVDQNTSLTDSFSMADDVLRQAIQGISDLILVPGLINLDFADVKAIMSGMGVTMMGTGIAEGENRAILAAQKAIASPLLEDGSVNGARGVIINVTGGPDLSLMAVHEASCVIQEAAHEDANIIFGAVEDPSLKGKIKITVIATGFERTSSHRGVPGAGLRTPVDLHSYTEHFAQPAEPAAVEQPVMEMDAPQLVGVTVPPLAISRRPRLDMTLPLAPSPSAGGGGANPVEGGGIDLSSPLDVPAFLRRQH